MSKIGMTKGYIIATPKEELSYPIPESDLDKLEKLVGEIIPKTTKFEILWSLAAGIFVSAGLSLLALYSVKDVPVWILNINWIILIVSLLAAMGFYKLDGQQSGIVKVSVDFITNEIRSLKDKYVIPTEQPPLTKPAKK